MPDYGTKVSDSYHNLKVNELKPFYVVEYPSKYAEMSDILFECDPLYIMLQQRGGLKISDIAGIFTNKGRAEEFAKKLLKEKPSKSIHHQGFYGW